MDTEITSDQKDDLRVSIVDDHQHEDIDADEHHAKHHQRHDAHEHRGDAHRHLEEHHRDVRGGGARAAVFGISDGLVSNVSLILAIAGGAGATQSGTVRLAGLAGLLAGAISMAAGEYVSMRAQTELLQRELSAERHEIVHNPESERRELVGILQKKGISKRLAEELSHEIHRDPDIALQAHAKEELGIDPEELGSAVEAAGSSFVAFGIGAFLPLAPWLFMSGTAAVLVTVAIASVTAIAVGTMLAVFTEQNKLRSALRQFVIAAFAAAATYGLGTLVGTGLG